MKPIEIISQDLFDKIRSRFKNLEMGDETGAVTINPAEARFFDFDFINEGDYIGRISISINEQGGLKIFYSQGITEDLDDVSKHSWYKFMKEMRMFAKRRLLRFDTRDISKSNLERKDFQYLAKKGAGAKEMPTMNESKWNSRNTKKTSRAVRGHTQVIVRHTQPVDEMYPGARSHPKKIKAIFIENKDGERFKYPFIHTAGAFAMAQHVDHGGIPHDPAGKAIIRMSQQIAQLQEFQKHIQRSQLHDDAMQIAGTAHSKLMELRSLVEALGKRKNYEKWIENFNNMIVDENLPELDAVTIEDYKSKFTQTNFKEELMKFFPLIHKIMQETNAIDLDQYISETDTCNTCYKDPCVCDEKVDEGKDEFVQFENWANFVESNELELTDDQIKGLKKALEELSTPLEFETAMRFFNEYGIDDEDLEKRFEEDGEAADDAEDSSADPMNTFIAWANDTHPELIEKLGITVQQPEPQAVQQPEPMPQQEPQSQQTEPKENTDMQMPVGTMENRNKSIIGKVAGICKQYYNEDNPNGGPWPKGEEGILTEIEKRISEEYGETVAEKARHLAEKFMEKLTKKWEDKHAQNAGSDDLSRLRQLARIDTEGIGDRGHGSKDFNNNIMPMSEWKAELAGGTLGGVAGSVAGNTVAGPIGGIVGGALGGTAGQMIGRNLGSEEQVNEFAPLIAAGARALAPALAKIGPKLGQMFSQAGKSAVQGAGQVAKQGAEIAAKNAVPIGLGAGAYQSITDLAKEIPGGVGKVYDDVTSAAAEIGKIVGGAVNSETIKQLADWAVKNAIPIGIVLALLYGGKKLLDTIFSESYDEELEEMTRIRKLSGLTK